MPDLGLQNHAAREFNFLITEKGYRRTLSNPNRVRFESQTTFFELVYDGNRSFELDLLVGEMGSEAVGHASYSIREILRLRQAPETKRFALVQVTSSEVLDSFIRQLAQALRTYGEDFIAGGQQGFADLKEQRKRETEAYSLERSLRRARAESEDAWRKRDYPAVVRALSPLRAALTATEIGKLEFAQKQVASHKRH